MLIRVPSTSVRLRRFFFAARVTTPEQLAVRHGRFGRITFEEECFPCCCPSSSLCPPFPSCPRLADFMRKGVSSTFANSVWHQHSILPPFSSCYRATPTAAPSVAAEVPQDTRRNRIATTRAAAGGRSTAAAGASPVAVRRGAETAAATVEVGERTDTTAVKAPDVTAAATDAVGTASNPAEVAAQTANLATAANTAARTPFIGQTFLQKTLCVPTRHLGQVFLSRALQHKRETVKNAVSLRAETRRIGEDTMWTCDDGRRDSDVCSPFPRRERDSPHCTHNNSKRVSSSIRSNMASISGSISNSSSPLPHSCAISSSAAVPPLTPGNKTTSSTSVSTTALTTQDSRASTLALSEAAAAFSPASTYSSVPSFPSLPIFSPGLEGVIAGESAVCTVSAEGTGLCYRGYPIEELVAAATFEEVLFLLLKARLPTKKELQQQQQTIAAARRLPPPLAKALECIPAHAHPMDVLRCGCSLLGTLEPETNPATDPPHIGLRLVSVYASMLLYWHFFSKRGLRLNVETEPTDSIAAHFFKLLHFDDPQYTLDPLEVHALDTSLILYAEHEFNASTFAARVTAATGSDMYSAICSAIGTLRGSLHGGANEAALHFLSSLSSPQQAEEKLHQMWLCKEKVMGFGHRVYKKEGDPRAPLLMRLAEQLSRRPPHNSKRQQQQEQLLAVAKHVEQLMLAHKHLYPNVDFSSAIVYSQCNIPVSFFTPLFAVARTAGWTAHVMEQREKNRLIRPLSLYTGPQRRPFLPLLERELRREKKEWRAAEGPPAEATEARATAAEAEETGEEEAAAGEIERRKQRTQQQQQEWQSGDA